MGIFDLPSKTLVLLGVIIAYVMMDDLSPNEQNALGNFLMLIGQAIEANAAIIQAQQGSGNIDDLNRRVTNLENNASGFRN